MRSKESIGKMLWLLLKSLNSFCRQPEKPAMIIELKYDKSAEGAIAQIKEKRYLESLKEYKGNLLLVGINYDKKTKKHTCVIEKCNVAIE